MAANQEDSKESQLLATPAKEIDQACEVFRITDTEENQTTNSILAITKPA